MRGTLTVVTFAVVLAATTAGQNSTENVFGRCILPLGMEEGKIPDDAITASSSYETKSVGPQNARIRQEKNGGAWCPKAQISSAIREYLEIDLTRDHLITWTETQGRFGNGQGQEYAEAFFLEYWRDANWHHYKNLRGERVLRGNSNTYLVEKQKLELPFVASRVRFVPYSQHPRTVCMRVEIYGCLWEQHVRSYSTPKGSNLGPGGWDLQDSSYDGEEIDSILANGLGQLTDGIVGQASELLSPPTSDTGRASNWVGWSNRATLRLTFHFQQLREFENCSVYAARIPHLQVQTFSTLRIWFSVDGEKYQSDAEKLESSIDPSSAVVDTVSASIPLQSRVGRVVKLEFSLAAKWLLLSEITFHTGSRNRSTDPYSWIDRSFEAERNETESGAKSSSSLDSMLDFNETELYEESEEEVSTPDAFPVGTSQTYVGLVSGLLTVFVLFLTCTAFLLKQRGRNKVALLQKHTALLCDSSAPAIPIAPKDAKLSTSIVTGLSLIRKPIAIAASDGGPDPPDPPDAGSPAGFQPALLSQLSQPDDPRRSTLYETTYRVFSHQNLQFAESNAATRPANSSSDFARSSSFATSKSAEFTAAAYSTKKPAHLHAANPAQKIHEGYYAATDILTIKKRESPSSSSPFTPLQIREKSARLPRSIDSCNVRCVSRHRLRILDKLGEGNFGLVHLCEAKGIPIPEGGAIQNRQIVIVRSLWRGVVDSLRSDFAKDMRALGMLQHSNVAKVVALVEEEPFGAIFEYGQFGDLPSFLESSDTEKDASYASRSLNFVAQIASGMKYLESLNIAHCDLAARNCIVGRDLTIKVSDHAVYCAKYDHHYFVDGHNAKIPIRWMAWEAALLGKRSCQADVWSFAVTVWEIFLNCKEMPYADLTVPQVLENCGRWYRSDTVIGDGSSYNYDDDDDVDDDDDDDDDDVDDDDDDDDGNGDSGDHGGRNQPRILSQPDRCPDQLYHAMTKCWSKRIEDRPTFQQIYLYLESFSLD